MLNYYYFNNLLKIRTFIILMQNFYNKNSFSYSIELIILLFIEILFFNDKFQFDI